METCHDSESTQAGENIPGIREEDFKEFYSEVKEIEKRDSALTSLQQTDRLLRPGSTYINLNPFEVLQVDPGADLSEFRRKYKVLSILVHPDRNLDDSERAQRAFVTVNKAWKTLEDEENRVKCLDVVDEAKARAEQAMVQERKKLKREGKKRRGAGVDETAYRRAVYVLTMKLFADMERKRRNLEERNSEETRRQEEEAVAVAEREWLRCYEESRQWRVNSWKAFRAGGGGAKNRHRKGLLRPPKHKAELRQAQNHVRV